MAGKPPMITCVMCGLQGPSAVEDVIPKWLARQLDLESSGTPPYFNRELEPAEQGFSLKSERHIGGLPVAWKLPGVCKSCNNGWMSDLEEGMKRAGKRLIEGKACLLDPYDQVVVATWAVKTALLYDVARGDRQIPPAWGCRRFYRTGAPPPRSQVVLGLWPERERGFGLPHRRFSFARTEVATEDVAMQGVEVAFAFGRLYLSVWINYRDEVPLALVTPVADKPYLVECWPLSGEAISWPPPPIPVKAAGERRGE